MRPRLMESRSFGTNISLLAEFDLAPLEARLRINSTKDFCALMFQKSKSH